MPIAFRVNDGVVVKDGVAVSEAENFRALERAVLASEAKKKDEERQRRISLGMSPEEKKEHWFKRWCKKFPRRD